jgi:hypothetical protein
MVRQHRGNQAPPFVLRHTCDARQAAPHPCRFGRRLVDGSVLEHVEAGRQLTDSGRASTYDLDEEQLRRITHQEPARIEVGAVES